MFSSVPPRPGVKTLSTPVRWWRNWQRWSSRLSLGVTAFLLVSRPIINWQLQRELNEIERLKQPLILAQMQLPQIPDAQNAAPIYRKAAAALRFESNDESYLSARVNKALPLDARALEILNRNAQSLQLTRTAAARVEWRAMPQQNALQSDVLNEHRHLRHLARLLHASAVRSAQKNSSAALEDVRAIFRMSHHLQRETSMVGFLVGAALHAMASRALGDVLQLSPIDAATGRAFEESLPPTDWRAAYERALLGERASSRALFNLVRTNGDKAQALSELTSASAPDSQTNEPDWLKRAWLWLWWPVTTLDEVHLLRAWQRHLRVAQLPLPAAPEAMESLAKIEDDVPFYAPMTRTLMPAFNRAPHFRDGCFAREKLRIVALNLSAHRKEHERYPASVLRLLAQVTLDPYRIQILGYRTNEAGSEFLLYSVGPNRRDEGGRRARDGRQPRAPSDADDIVWNPPPPDFFIAN